MLTRSRHETIARSETRNKDGQSVGFRPGYKKSLEALKVSLFVVNHFERFHEIIYDSASQKYSQLQPHNHNPLTSGLRGSQCRDAALLLAGLDWAGLGWAGLEDGIILTPGQ